MNSIRYSRLGRLLAQWGAAFGLILLLSPAAPASKRPPPAPVPIASASTGDLNVKDFGARGGGTTDDSAALQSAINALPSTGGTVLFPPGTYQVTHSLLLPVTAGAPHAEFVLRGSGATLTTGAPIPILTQAVPASMDQAMNEVNRRFRITGLRFEGTSRASQAGVVLIATYGSVIEDCTFEHLDTGLDLIFCLMAQVRGCFGLQNRTVAFRARGASGVISDANGSNSASNHTTFASCRDYASPGQQAQFLVEDASGVRIEDCIVEGNNPVDSVRYDARGTTTSKTFFVKNLHVENVPGPTEAILRLLAMGNVEVDGVFFQYPSVVIDSRGSCEGGLLTVRNVPWWPGGSKFAQTPLCAFRWVIEDGIGSYGQTDAGNPANWAGGSRAYYLTLPRDPIH